MRIEGFVKTSKEGVLEIENDDLEVVKIISEWCNFTSVFELEDKVVVNFEVAKINEVPENEEDEEREVVMPNTKIHSAGKHDKLWCKVLHEIDGDAKDAYGFKGAFVQRGSLYELSPGSIVLEMAGRSKKEEGRLYILWMLDEEYEWEELARSDEPSWAKVLREAAEEAMGDEE